ncbi:MAG: hypothetical protein WD512_02260, partial [Candidatus Paceibacterota bacterium]
ASPLLVMDSENFYETAFCMTANQLAFQPDKVGLSNQINYLVSHVQNSIVKADNGISKLSSEVLNIHGMSSAKVRHLLNNLCNKENTRYFEVRVWKGSTWISALYGNRDNIDDAVAIDNWSRFGGPREEFFENCKKFLPNYAYRVYSENSFSIDLKSSFILPMNVYFYDGDHSALSQEMALTYFDDILDDVFILIVDDWNREEVKRGTIQGIQKLNYQVAYQIELPGLKINDDVNWWNGLYVAVIFKNQTK